MSDPDASVATYCIGMVTGTAGVTIALGMGYGLTWAGTSLMLLGIVGEWE